MASEYGWPLGEIKSVELIEFLELLNAMKDRKNNDAMKQAQIVSLPHAGEDGWNNFLQSLGITPPKFHDLVNAAPMTPEEIDAQMKQFMQANS